MLAYRHPINREALRLAGAIVPLRRLLDSGVDSPVTVHAVAAFAALATGNDLNKDDMRRAGCIPALVTLCAAGASKPSARMATSTLMALCYQHPANRQVRHTASSRVCRARHSCAALLVSGECTPSAGRAATRSHLIRS